MNNTSCAPTKSSLKPTLLHLWCDTEIHYISIQKHFDNLPRVGEHIALEEDDYYLVESVVHIAFSGAEYSAEVFVRKIDPPACYRLVS